MAGSLVAGAMVAVVVAQLPRAAEAASSSYPLTCRGGGLVSTTVTGQSAAGGRQLRTSFAFRKGTVGTSNGGTFDATRVPAGGCTWSDRGIRSDEPRYFKTDASGSDVVTSMMELEIERCMLDEHCVFVIPARRDGNFLVGTYSPYSRIQFVHLP